MLIRLWKHKRREANNCCKRYFENYFILQEQLLKQTLHIQFPAQNSHANTPHHPRHHHSTLSHRAKYIQLIYVKSMLQSVGGIINEVFSGTPSSAPSC